MKKKILFYGWENYKVEGLREQMQKWADKYEIVFATYDTHALDKLSVSKIVNRNPITGIVFKRSSLVVNPDVCKLIARFAEYLIEHGEPMLVSVSLIHNDQDTEARDCSVSAHFAKEGDWEQVFNILKNN